MRFVLVHGALHGAWCWDRLIPEIENLGLEAVASDLPGHGTRFDELATLERYKEAVVASVRPGDVIVAHSLGGWIATAAAALVVDRIGGMIYLAAGVPVEGMTIADSVPGGFDLGSGDALRIVDTDQNGRCLDVQDLDAASSMFFHDCTPEDQLWAVERLGPEPLAPLTVPISVPSFWTHRIPRSYVICTEDRTHGLEFDSEMMRRLDLPSCVAIRSSHSPFISRPEETANVLLACTEAMQSSPPHGRFR